MSLEAIKQITEIERSYQLQKEEALATAQKLVIDAEREGKTHLEKEKAQAESESRFLLKEAEDKAARHGEELLKEAEIRCGSLKKTAEERLEKAVSMIVERVVSI